MMWHLPALMALLFGLAVPKEGNAGAFDSFADWNFLGAEIPNRLRLPLPKNVLISQIALNPENVSVFGRNDPQKIAVYFPRISPERPGNLLAWRSVMRESLDALKRNDLWRYIQIGSKRDNNLSGGGCSGIRPSSMDYNISIIVYRDRRWQNSYVGTDLSAPHCGGLSNSQFGGIGIPLGSLQGQSCVFSGSYSLASGAGIGLHSDAIAAPGLIQRAMCLPKRVDQAAHTDCAEQRGDDSPIRSPTRLTNGFFRSDSSAPLGAQIGLIVFCGIIAGISITHGIRNKRLFRGRLSLIAGLSILVGLMYWVAAS